MHKTWQRYGQLQEIVWPCEDLIATWTRPPCAPYVLIWGTWPEAEWLEMRLSFNVGNVYTKLLWFGRDSRTSGSAARHPSLYFALRARPWLRMSQSYDLSDVDTTLMLFAAATVCNRTQSWQWVSWNVALWTLARAYCSCCCRPEATPDS